MYWNGMEYHQKKRRECKQRMKEKRRECVCVYIYIYIYIERERENKEKGGEWKTGGRTTH